MLRILALKQLPILLICVGLAISANPLVAQTLPRACKDHRTDRWLSSGDPKVVADNAAFVRMGRSYDFSIFSLAAADPRVAQNPYKICLRYEFKNDGAEKIQVLTWSTAQAYGVTVDPGEQIDFPRVVWTNTQSVKTGPTELFAFEHSQATGLAVFPLHQSIIGGPSDHAISSFSLTKIGSPLDRLLTASRASTNVQAFYLPSRTLTYPVFSSGLVSSRITISIESIARINPQDRIANIRNVIRVVRHMPGKVVIFAPGLLSLEQRRFGPTDSLEDKSSTFLGRLPKNMVPLTLSDSMHTSALQFRTSTDANAPAIFVVKQPVTIKVGAWSACLIADAYSPIPVSLSSAQCQNR